MSANTIITSVVTGGTNSHATTAEEANAFVTDFVTQGVVGSFTPNTGSGGTGSFAVNQNTGSNMAINIKAGQAYISATPSSQGAQVLRARAAADYTAYTINSNSSGSTKYDWIYLKVDSTAANNPASDASDVTSIFTSRSSSNVTDNGSPPTYGLVLAVITVANGATSITNSNVTDKRVSASSSSSGGSIIVTQSATGQDAIIQAAGVDANVNLHLKAKGVAAVDLGIPFKFFAYQSSSQAVTTGSDVKVNLQTAIFDTGSNFSTSTSLFTAPVAGFYFFSWSVTFPLVNNGIMDTLLYVNGAVTNGIAGGTVANSTGGTQTKATTGAGLLQLAANDTVGLYVNVPSNASINAFRSQTYLQGYLVTVT